MSGILSAVSDLIAYVIGGTVGSGSSAVTITLGNSWVGQFASTIVSSPVLLISFVMGLSLFGIHVMKSLMGR